MWAPRLSLWFNFAPERLHWARYAGKNFTDRQRIKRKAQSWGRRYAALPAAERLAVLGAMMASRPSGRPMATVNKASLRSQSSTRSSGTVPSLCAEGKMPPESRSPSSTPC